MQTPLDLICTECSNTFDSASLLLQHFASHAVKNLENEITSPRDKKKERYTEFIPNKYAIRCHAE
ncbi:hypothetical protein NQ315_007802 [Exocentrus adspersus]|uniref:C2H2-type domain-containing protein n=1 Tax=Exocentrus adspersus TaxID=1586481 RepID=A0AAV8W8X1_9CUCU|nr:hypothetical protein NQ315_007802 [Exocentrus adspersus]